MEGHQRLPHLTMLLKKNQLSLGGSRGLQLGNLTALTGDSSLVKDDATFAPSWTDHFNIFFNQPHKTVNNKAGYLRRSVTNDPAT